MSEPKCPVCDLPALADGIHEPWQGNRDLCCERWFLAGRGLQNQFASDYCRKRAVNWRQRYLTEVAAHAGTATQLKVAQRALSRHHEASHRDVGMFRNGARIT